MKRHTITVVIDDPDPGRGALYIMVRRAVQVELARNDNEGRPGGYKNCNLISVKRTNIEIIPNPTCETCGQEVPLK